MTDCKHNISTDAQVNFNYLEDSGRYTADITIKCGTCGVPFRFLGLPIGLDLTGAAVSPDGLEGRFSMAPGKEPIPNVGDGIRGFGVKFFRQEDTQ